MFECAKRDHSSITRRGDDGATGAHTTLPTTAPIPAVSPIAQAPQNATRIVGFTKPAPPALAPIAPSSDRKSSDPAATDGINALDGATRTRASGAAAPTEK